MENETKTHEDFDEEMIAMVRKCPFLFDNARVDFKDVTKRQRAWESIGKALGQRPEVVERRWMSLRNQYSKKIREEQLRPHSGAKLLAWKRGQSLAWLKPFIKGRRRRVDILRVGQMSEWSQQNHFSSTDLSHHRGNIPLNMSVLALPDDVTLSRNIDHPLAQVSTNGHTSMSSQSPTWSHNYPDHRDDKNVASGGRNFHGSSSSSSSYARSFPSATGDPVVSNGEVDDGHMDSYQSDNDNSREYKPFELCEVQENNKDYLSMVGVVRDVVRQELALEDEDAHFAKSIAQMLRRMDRSKRNRAKVRLLQLLSEIDDDDPS